MGGLVLTVWECALKNIANTAQVVLQSLHGGDDCDLERPNTGEADMSTL